MPTDERRKKISMHVVSVKKKLRVNGRGKSNWGDLLEWLRLVQGLFLGELIFLGPRPAGYKIRGPRARRGMRAFRNRSGQRAFQARCIPLPLPGLPPQDAGRQRSLSGPVLPYLFPDALPSRHRWSAHCTSSTSNLLQNCAYLTLSTAPTLVPVPSSLARQILPKQI